MPLGDRKRALAMEAKLSASHTRIAPQEWADAFQVRQRYLRFDYRFIGGKRCDLVLLPRVRRHGRGIIVMRSSPVKRILSANRCFCRIKPVPPDLVLASASRYRRELLERLRVPFQVDAADIDESPLAAETPLELVSRLAREKASHVAIRHPTAYVIGADQIAVCRDEILGKPGNPARNIAQLQRASGQALRFYTATCLVRSKGELCEEHVDETTVQFRDLSELEISRYVELERPYDCAGGFKCEGLGITLFERIDSQDPTALIGLPLIWLSGALRRAGARLP